MDDDVHMRPGQVPGLDSKPQLPAPLRCACSIGSPPSRATSAIALGEKQGRVDDTTLDGPPRSGDSQASKAVDDLIQTGRGAKANTRTSGSVPVQCTACLAFGGNEDRRARTERRLAARLSPCAP